MCVIIQIGPRGRPIVSRMLKPLVCTGPVHMHRGRLSRPERMEYKLSKECRAALEIVTVYLSLQSKITLRIIRNYRK